jgi:hypothetical protein
MRVLRIYKRERERTQSLADGVDVDSSSRFAAHPKIERRYFDAARDDVVGDSYLPVELQRSRLHGQRP